MGVENTENRFKQADLVEYMRKIPFAESRPNIKVKTITIDEHELDIITIINCKDTPLYLTKDFKD